MSQNQPLTGCVAEEELSAYLDEDLDAGRAEQVASHLESCRACRQVLDELVALTGDLPALARVEPDRDLWPAIARRHARRGSGVMERLRRWWAVPAAVAVGAAAAVLLVLMLVGTPGQRTRGQYKRPVEALTAVIRAEQTYVEAIASLKKALQGQEAGYSPRVRRTVEQGLADIDRTIERCRRALLGDPSDLGAHEVMLAAYQHEVDYLTDLLGESL